ncbi:MAG: hypothetical protein HYY62_08675 [Deltaproteobacteria bacterium]|nr:hypothetical protein [Deltaproteobacteria bacterium]
MKHYYYLLFLLLLSWTLIHCGGGGGGDGSSGVSGSQDRASQERLDITTLQDSFEGDTLIEEIPKISFNVSASNGLKRVFFISDHDTHEIDIPLSSQGETTFSHIFSFPLLAHTVTVIADDLKGKRIQKVFTKNVSSHARQWKIVSGRMDYLLSASGVAVDAQENMYVSDTGHHRILKITPSGETTVVASGTEVVEPTDIDLTSDGKILFLDGNKIKRIDGSGQISTVLEGNFLRAFTVTSSGELYFLQDIYLKKFDASGNHTTIAGNTMGSVADSLSAAINVKLVNSREVIVDEARSKIYIQEGPSLSGQEKIRVIDGLSSDRPIRKWYEPITASVGMAVDSVGDFYFLSGSKLLKNGSEISFDDRYNNLIKRMVMSQTGNIYIVGYETSSPANAFILKINKDDGRISEVAGSMRDASLNGPRHIAIHPQNRDLYVSDSEGHTINKITSSGQVEIYAGSKNNAAYSGDEGSATQARLNSPTNLAFDKNGHLYFVDSGNYSIRKITSGGLITTLAGTGSMGFSDPSKIRFLNILSMTADPEGNVFVFESNGRFRRINIKAQAQDFGSNLQTNYIIDMISDGDGNIYIADRENNRIKKITAAGSITPVAEINQPKALALDDQGNLFVLQGSDQIQRISKDNQSVVTVFTSSDGIFEATDIAIRGSSLFVVQPRAVLENHIISK